MTDTELKPASPEPRAIAKAVLDEMADAPEQVGDFIETLDLGDGVTDFRFAANVRGYEGWQWSVTLFHDAEVDAWTINESSLVPTDAALMPPKWIPWKDRLLPSDLSPTDSIGTDLTDGRLEEGVSAAEGAQFSEGTAEEALATEAGESGDVAQSAQEAKQSETAELGDDAADVVEEFALSRRHVMTPLGRSQTAQRWYEGPRGPKALSTKTADGNLCSTCGFFIPLKGELDRMFGVCANKWSPDDGRVVSLDHGCGEHSEIEPPEPSHLWVQSKPKIDEMHIDVVAQQPREELGQIEAIEELDDEATEEDILANTEFDDDESDDDAADEQHAYDDVSPELETVVDLMEMDESSDNDDDDIDDDDDDIDIDDEQ